MSLETLNRGKRVSSSSREEQLQPLMFFFIALAFRHLAS